MKIHCRQCSEVLAIDADHVATEFNCLVFGCPTCKLLHIFPTNHKELPHVIEERTTRLKKDIDGILNKGRMTTPELPKGD